MSTLKEIAAWVAASVLLLCFVAVGSLAKTAQHTEGPCCPCPDRNCCCRNECPCGDGIACNKNCPCRSRVLPVLEPEPVPSPLDEGDGGPLLIEQFVEAQ